MENDIIFKKAAFGGFDKDDVMNYIAKITDEFQAYKTQTVKTINALKEKVDKLEKANKDLQEQYNALTAELKEQESVEEKNDDTVPSTTDEIKSIIESLYENINGFITTLSDGNKTDSQSDENESGSEDASDVSADEISSDDELLKIIDKYVD